MSRRRLTERVAGGLPWLGAAALVAALLAHRSALESAQARTAELEGPAHRTWVADRVLGADLSEVRLPAPEGGEGALHRGEGWTLVWLVDPAACPACLDRTGAWREVIRRPGLDGAVVLVGVTAARAARMRARASLDGRVLADPDGELSASMGVSEVTPAVFALADRDGIVALAEARRAATTCDWSFPRQAAALVAGGDARRLREGGT